MEMVPVVKKDLKELVRVVRLASPGLDYVDADVLEDQTLLDPGYDPSYLLKAMDKKVCVGMALGVARGLGPSKTGFIKYFGVAPKFRRRGTARALFSELERRFQKRGVTELKIGECPAPYLKCGIDVTDTASVCFLLRRGYQRGDTLIDMTASLSKWKPTDSPEEKALAKTHGVKKATAADAGPLMEMVNKAFPSWSLEVERGLKRGVVFIARDKGAVTAFACGNATLPGFFGPMGTLESHRKTGMGRLLLRRTLEAMKSSGVKTARIPWIGPVPFYAKHAGAVLGPVAWPFTKKL
ncbi:MAG: GNAT family N-acetyltransferase [candidate division FCPU426 bacterium]